MIDGGEYINIVSYGGGANSTALLIGLHQHRIPVDLILFADTGGEHPHTYAYLDIMDDDPNTKSYENMLPLNYSIAGWEEQYKEIFKNKKNYYRKYRDMSIFAMIAVYLLSVVDAYVDAELSSFDISKDFGLRIEPAVFNFGGRGREASVGVQCNLNF